MKCKECNGSCRQGRDPCNCDEMYDHDWKVTLILAGIFTAMVILGFLMEYFHA